MRATFLIPLLIACAGGDPEGEAPGTEPTPTEPERADARLPRRRRHHLPLGRRRLQRLQRRRRAPARRLSFPMSVAFHPDFEPVVADWNNHKLRMVLDDPADGFETIMGTDHRLLRPRALPGGQLGVEPPHQRRAKPGGPQPRLRRGVAQQPHINVIDLTTGELHWFAGNGGRQYGGDGDPAADATLDLPSSVAFDERNGDLYIPHQANHIIRRIPAGSDTIELFAGQPRQAGYEGDGGDRLSANFHGFVAQKADPGSKLTIHDGVIYYADSVNGVVRTIDIDSGVVAHFAGKYTSLGAGEVVDDDGNVSYFDLGSVPGYSGDGGPATEAELNTPRDVAVGPDGSVYVADTKNDCVRVVDPSTGVIDTFAGRCGTPGYDGDGGPATEALLANPFGVATDAEGNVYIADSLNHVIRRVKR